MKKTYAVLAAIAAIVLIVYAILPSRSFCYDVFPRRENVLIDKYDDRTDGGTSEATIAVEDSLLDFSCVLGMDTTAFAWCGILWNLDPAKEGNYENWTFVDSLFLDVDASGTDEIIFKVWTYDPDVTDLEKPRSFKLLMKEVPLKQGRQKIAIPMEQFYTPEFWFQHAGVDQSYDKRHQESVARVEITPGWKHPRGKKFTLKVYGVSACGISNVYFGAVLIIFLILTIVAVGRRHRQEHDEK